MAAVGLRLSGGLLYGRGPEDVCMLDLETGLIRILAPAKYLKSAHLKSFIPEG